MIRSLRDLIVTFAGPMPPSLPGAGWRVWLLTSAPTILAAVWANYRTEGEAAGEGPNVRSHPSR